MYLFRVVDAPLVETPSANMPRVLFPADDPPVEIAEDDVASDLVSQA
jgi:hypothetical protein